MVDVVPRRRDWNEGMGRWSGVPEDWVRGLRKRDDFIFGVANSWIGELWIDEPVGDEEFLVVLYVLIVGFRWLAWISFVSSWGGSEFVRDGECWSSIGGGELESSSSSSWWY